MATLILTVVGTVIGGPIGGAIGAIAGQAIDRNIIFKPKGRQGPRLTELAVQTSSYGTPIPKLFGTLRVAGTVIWSTDLIESDATSSSGKGQPSVTNYSYSVSFAVLVSARAITGIKRIWADGKLLRGAAGDFKTQTGFRVLTGDEAQSADPMIAAAEGIARTPAHRGYAYAVFENFQLAEYGNHIPSLTFEVEADPAPVSVGAIAATLSAGRVDGGGATVTLGGFSAYGDSIRGVLETLASAGGTWFAPVDGGLAMRQAGNPGTIVNDDGYATTGGKRQRRMRSVAAIETVPKSIVVAHYDPSRDYQAGLQRASRPGAGSRHDRLEIAAALDAAAAKAIAERAIVRAEAARERRMIALSWAALRIAPGDIIGITGERGSWRVTGWSLEAMLVALDLVRVGDAAASGVASAGRVLPVIDAVQGPTIIEAFETPPLGDQVYMMPRLTIAAAGTEPGWRRAALLYSIDGGLSFANAGATAAAAVIGAVAIGTARAPATLRDLAGSIEVELAHRAMTLADADDAALDAGANLALLGMELVQFGHADQIGDRRWRLSRLLRGRRGTEPSVIAAGARFVVVAADRAVGVDVPIAALDGNVSVLASGVGDLAGPAAQTAVITGASLRPPSPVHVTIDGRGSGYLTVRWARRSRAGWRWIDGADAPLVEEREAYRISIISAAVRQELDAPGPSIVLPEAPSTAWTAIEVRQRGTFGDSPPARIDF